MTGDDCAKSKMLRDGTEMGIMEGDVLKAPA